MIWKHELEQHDSDNEDVEDDDDNRDDEMLMPTGDETIPPVEDEDDIDVDVTSISKPWKKSIIEPEGIEVPVFRRPDSTGRPAEQLPVWGAHHEVPTLRQDGVRGAL